jgi:hypothetical protein
LERMITAGWQASEASINDAISYGAWDGAHKL